MKISYTLLIAFVLFISPEVFGQYPYHHHYNNRVYIESNPRILRLGDMVYSPNYQGVKNLMFDYQINNPEMHDILLPEFNRLKRKRNVALTTMVGSQIVGITLFVGGFTFLSDRGNPFSTTDGFQQDVYVPNVLVIVAGSFISTFGLFGGILLLPNREDIYHFVNYHNRYSNGEKIEWKIGLNIAPTNTGLSLTMNF